MIQRRSSVAAKRTGSFASRTQSVQVRGTLGAEKNPTTLQPLVCYSIMVISLRPLLLGTTSGKRCGRGKHPTDPSYNVRVHVKADLGHPPHRAV